jgi:hypothetical protein
MKRFNFDAPKMALDVRVSYYWSLFAPDGTEVHGPNPVRPWELRSIRDNHIRLTVKGWRIAVTRDVLAWPVEVCFYCQARPCAIDYDIDGAYRTATCDSDQCRQGSNPDNSGWVAGEAPLWGPEHPEWHPYVEQPYAFADLSAFGPDEPQF